MSRAFFDANAKAETLAAIKAIERETSAEVVVAVRPSSGSYRSADFLFGALSAWAALVFLLFAPYPFAVASMPVDVIIVFALGALVSARTTWPRLLLTSRKSRQRAVLTEARAAFVDLGIGKTQRRAGVLVFVSILEKSIVLVPDVAVEKAREQEAWKRARAALETVLAPRAELARFVGALRALGPALALGLPHHEGDVNELPDEVA